jgi:hypothetical protein
MLAVVLALGVQPLAVLVEVVIPTLQVAQIQVEEAEEITQPQAVQALSLCATPAQSNISLVAQ